MTFGQMQELFYQRIDQSGSPDFTAQETDRLLNWGYDVWYIINRPKFDKDQANSVNMTHLIRPFSFFNISEITVVGSGANIPNYRDLSRMTATFDFIDCDQATVRKSVNVVPMSQSEEDTNASDPFNSFTNEYPRYVQKHNGTYRIIKVRSGSTPISLQGDYFKELQAIDCEFNPNTQFEAQDYIARQVIEIAKILAKGDLDDYPAVRNAVQESAMTMG